MKCVICKHGETQLGKTTITLERDHLTLIIKHVPAQICQNCGEEYLSAATTEHLFKTAEDVAQAGAYIDIREYAVM